MAGAGIPGVYGRSRYTGHHAEAIAAPHIEQSEYWGVLYSEYAKEDLMREVYVLIRAPFFSKRNAQPEGQNSMPQDCSISLRDRSNKFRFKKFDTGKKSRK